MHSHHFHKYVLSKKKITVVDRCMMVASAAYPLMSTPQILSIYLDHNVQGVSLTTWVGFMSFGTIFLTYAVVHRIKPLIVSQILWMIADILVVAGVLLYR